MRSFNGKEYPTASDLKPPNAIEGAYKKLSELQGQPLLIQGVKSLRERPSPKGNMVPTAVVKARTASGELVFFYTSHTVLLDKISFCFGQAPGGFVATIIKKGLYYDIE